MMMRAAVVGGMALAVWLAGAVVAAELPLETRIAAVTVFPDRAEVTRTGHLALEAGSHVALIAGLPAGLIPDSVRVAATGSEAFRLGSVETRTVFGAAPAVARERELAARIEALEDQARALADRIAAERLKLDFVRSIGRNLPERANDELLAGAPDPAVWQRSWEVLAAGAGEALAAIRAAEIEQRSLERELERLRRERAELETGATETVEARLDLEAPTPLGTEIRLTYQVQGASWRPLYEARLETAGGRLLLVQRGEVRQATGEDWPEVALTLATARPGTSAPLAELEPWFVAIEEPRPLPAAPPLASYRGGKGLAEQQQADTAAARPVTAEIVSSEFAAEYRIPLPASVTADNAARSFTIAERELVADLAVQTTPRRSTDAWLYGRVTHPGPEPLLPGSVAVFRDGAFVGRSELAPVRPGESFDLAFGVDDKVAVDYRLETGGRSSEGLFNKRRRLERRYRTEVTNHHAGPIRITVKDQIPVPQDERIEVELLADSTPPTARDRDGRRGVLEWEALYAPGEGRVIALAYTVSLPEGLELAGF
jgi:uncharacterized protein (TIGR02231 family)